MEHEIWKRCLTPHHALKPTEVCDEPLRRWEDGSWRCAHGHFNTEASLRSEALGMMVRDVQISWTRDKASRVYARPWQKLRWEEQCLNRRIGETLAGIRDWRVGQRPGNMPPAAADPDVARRFVEAGEKADASLQAAGVEPSPRQDDHKTAGPGWRSPYETLVRAAQRVAATQPAAGSKNRAEADMWHDFYLAISAAVDDLCEPVARKQTSFR